MNQDQVPVFDEVIGGALLDAARINVMAARAVLPSFGPSVLLPGDENMPPTLDECLEQAAQWLDHARALTIAMAQAAPTSLHVVAPPGAKR